MTRPEPKRSRLAGLSPVTPPAQAESQTEPDAPATPRPAARGTVAEPAARRRYPPKVSFYQDPEDTARVRGAILHTMATEGSRSMSQFINDAVMAEVERLEVKYNGGQHFPPVGSRELPQGRPLGS